ncbi:MAG TPA: GAF domain-containing protein, partial [Chthoniobacterales bacterium]
MPVSCWFKSLLDTKIVPAASGGASYYGDVRIVNNDTEILAISPLETRYETLIRVSQAVEVHRDPEELFDALAAELRRVVPFSCIRISIRDQNTNTSHDRFIDMGNRSAVVLGERLITDERLTSWVYEHQEPLVTSLNQIEPQHECVHAILKRFDIRSMCILPLTTAHRKLGAITFGSKQLDAYSSEEVRFLSLVAEQIALAFDNSLNFTTLQKTSEELRSNNERLELLLDVTNKVVSNLELRDLLRAISQDVRRVMQCDYAGLSLPEADNKQLRLYAVDFPEGKGFLQEDLTFSIEGVPSGTAFRTMKPLSIQSPFTDWLNSPIVQAAAREGLESFCFLPLISRNRAIGVLVLGRLRDDAFSQVDIDFLTQVANQIALAVENALAYREIRELKDQL